MAVRLAVMGAGLIGRRHIGHIQAEACAELAAIVDPTPEAQAFAAGLGVPCYASFADMAAVMRPEGVVVATPNALHVDHGLECVMAGLPVLVEKPIAPDVDSAARLVEAAERAGVPLLVGHHRRHNPVVARAKQVLDAGQLGTVVAAHASCWFHKPDSYFDAAWRREEGAGPVFLNLVHDVDLLRHLVGPVVSVQAMESSAQRGFAVEDTATVLLRFANGALGTVTVSDTVAAPWSWELTSGENSAYSHTPESSLWIGGTHGSLTVPALDLWRHDGEPDWWNPIAADRVEAPVADPLALQIQNLSAVIRATAVPVVTGRDGLDTLRVIAAIKQAAATGRTVHVG